MKLGRVSSKARGLLFGVPGGKALVVNFGERLELDSEVPA